MLIIPPGLVRRRRVKYREGPPLPPGLTLVAGAYHEQEWVRLTFDRAIDIAGIDVTQIVVLDGYINEKRWIGSGAATLVDPATVHVPLVDDGFYSGENGVLDATAATGILAVDNGGTWPGASGFVLSWE